MTRSRRIGEPKVQKILLTLGHSAKFNSVCFLAGSLGTAYLQLNFSTIRLRSIRPAQDQFKRIIFSNGECLRRVTKLDSVTSPHPSFPPPPRCLSSKKDIAMRVGKWIKHVCYNVRLCNWPLRLSRISVPWSFESLWTESNWVPQRPKSDSLKATITKRSLRTDSDPTDSK